MNKKVALAVAYFAPFLVFAQASTDVQGILATIRGIFDIIIPFIVTLALIYFLWGVAQYIISQGDEEGRKNARSMMLNGIIALFVIVSVWGLVLVLNNTFGIGQGGTATPPGSV